MNNPPALSGDVPSADERRKKAGSEIVKFVGIGTAKSEYNKFGTASARLARNISPEEELFVDYVRKYKFKQIFEW